MELPRPGLGISRRTLDRLMADHPGVQHGAVREVQQVGTGFTVKLEGETISAKVVVDAAGKLSRFTKRRAVPQFGVQFYEAGTRGDVLDFWFFEDGYGGAVTVEGGRSNACFLVNKDAVGALYEGVNESRMSANSPPQLRRGGAKRRGGAGQEIDFLNNRPAASRHPALAKAGSSRTFQFVHNLYERALFPPESRNVQRHRAAGLRKGSLRLPVYR